MEVDGDGESAAEKLIDQFRSIWRVNPFGPNLKSEDTVGAGRGGGVGEAGFVTRTWSEGDTTRAEETRTTAPVEGGWSWSLARIGFVPVVWGTGAGGGRATVPLETEGGAGHGIGVATREMRFVTETFPARGDLAEARATVEVVAVGNTLDVASAVHGTEPRPISRQTANERASTPSA